LSSLKSSAFWFIYISARISLLLLGRGFLQPLMAIPSGWFSLPSLATGSVQCIHSSVLRVRPAHRHPPPVRFCELAVHFNNTTGGDRDFFTLVLISAPSARWRLSLAPMRDVSSTNFKPLKGCTAPPAVCPCLSLAPYQGRTESSGSLAFLPPPTFFF